MEEQVALKVFMLVAGLGKGHSEKDELRGGDENEQEADARDEDARLGPNQSDIDDYLAQLLKAGKVAAIRLSRGQTEEETGVPCGVVPEEELIVYGHPDPPNCLQKAHEAAAVSSFKLRHQNVRNYVDPLDLELRFTCVARRQVVAGVGGLQEIPWVGYLLFIAGETGGDGSRTYF